MTEFFKSRAGQHYLNKQLPDLIKSNNRLAAALENQNKISEKLLIMERKKLKANGQDLTESSTDETSEES